MDCVSSIVAANVPLSKTGASKFLSMFTVKIAALVRGGLPPSCANTRTWWKETNRLQEPAISSFFCELLIAALHNRSSDLFLKNFQLFHRPCIEPPILELW